MSTENDKEELTEELEHQRQIVKMLRRRRRLLEHTHVIKGIETDPHILMQLEDISQQIKEREAEIDRLQTLSVEDKESLVEVEYRVAVAETFDTPQGSPSYAGNARLELLRLRLGIPKDQAKSIEAAVRSALAVRELGSLTRVELNTIRDIAVNQTLPASSSENDKNAKQQWSRCINVCKKLERAIHLDPESAIGWCNRTREPRPEELRQVLLLGNDYFSHFSQQILGVFVKRLEKAQADSKKV